MDATRDDLIYRETMLDAKVRGLASRGEAVNKEVDPLVAERKRSFESSERSFMEENDRLRESLATCKGLLSCFDELKRRHGDDPEKLLLELNGKTAELKALREELATQPSQELRQRFETQQLETDRLKARLQEAETARSELRQRLAGENDLRVKLREAETNNKALRNRAEILDAECTRLNDALKRMRAA